MTVNTSNVVQLDLPQESINKWEVTIEVEPRFAFLLVVIKAMIMRKGIRIHHTFKNDPRRRLN